MRSQIIQIGNSQGIRLPKIILEQSGISGEIEIDVRADGILIRNAAVPRSGWEAAFRSMAENDDEDSVEATETEFERKDWQW